MSINSIDSKANPTNSVTFYYLQELLSKNLDRLHSVGKGARLQTDSPTDLNTKINNLYLEATRINAVTKRLEFLASCHQTLISQAQRDDEELAALEKQIFTLIGFHQKQNSCLETPELEANTNKISAITCCYIGKLVCQKPNKVHLLGDLAAKLQTNPLVDLNVMIRSIYLESPKVDAVIKRLEVLVYRHQTVVKHAQMHQEELVSVEKQIFALLGCEQKQIQS